MTWSVVSIQSTVDIIISYVSTLALSLFFTCLLECENTVFHIFPHIVEIYPSMSWLIHIHHIALSDILIHLHHKTCVIHLHGESDHYSVTDHIVTVDLTGFRSPETGSCFLGT